MKRKKKDETALNVVRKFFPKVNKVVDALRPAIVEVTPADIHPTKKKMHAECAMAVACKRQFKLDGVIIARTRAYMVKGTLARRFMVPNTVAREVTAFDRGAEFSPGTYELAAVVKSARLGTQRPATPPHSGPHGGESRFRHITNNVRHVLAGRDPDIKANVKSVPKK